MLHIHNHQGNANKIHNKARCWWLTPVILATQEADQKDHGLKPTQANSSRDPISKIPNTKQGWWSGPSGRAPA
jgi:hypothetical protein